LRFPCSGRAYYVSRSTGCGAGPVVATDDLISLPKGARLISTSASAGRLAVLIEIDGGNELRTFDIKTLKQTGRLRFTREP